MDLLLALATACAVTLAGAALPRFAVRAGLAPLRRQQAPDAADRRTAYERRLRTCSDFAEDAEQIGHIVEMWPVLAPAARRPQHEAARTHLRWLERRLGPVLLNSDADVATAARQLVDECTRLVDRLYIDAPPGPVDTSARLLSMPFLRACAKHFEAESDQRSEGHFAEPPQRAQPTLSGMRASSSGGSDFPGGQWPHGRTL
ncbi:hypothetical protein [Streptomyces flavofungini]|uniref:hypothetical protein n=1 Tax=Streptomyces flavofungini TaxID=68200 RepID=UPI0034E04037